MQTTRGRRRQRVWDVVLLGTAFLVLGQSSFRAQERLSAGHGALEATSALGRPLYALPDDATIFAAKKALAADATNVALVLKLSQAEAGRRQYREAVALCTKAIQHAPASADLYIERGHRELGLREFKLAMADLRKATELDPAKLDAHYHLGLSHYFLGEFPEAAASFNKARALAKSDDSLIDCSNWLYVSLRRAGKQDEAAAVLARITPQVHNTEPHLLFYLRLLRFYQGQITQQAVLPPRPTKPDDVESELSFNTVSYGVGNWDLYNHHVPPARTLFESVVQGQAWNSWGFIGSETELARMKR